MDTEEIIKHFKEVLKERLAKEPTWPITVTYPDGAPFKKAEFYEDGTAKVWPSQPLNWISLNIKLEPDKD
jgi:hypothetical protein